jgi:hypothetical protein
LFPLLNAKGADTHERDTSELRPYSSLWTGILHACTRV